MELQSSFFFLTIKGEGGKSKPYHKICFLQMKPTKICKFKKSCTFVSQTRKDLTDCKPRKKNAKAVLLFKTHRLNPSAKATFKCHIFLPQNL